MRASHSPSRRGRVWAKRARRLGGGSLALACFALPVIPGGATTSAAPVARPGAPAPSAAATSDCGVPGSTGCGTVLGHSFCGNYLPAGHTWDTVTTLAELQAALADTTPATEYLRIDPPTTDTAWPLASTAIHHHKVIVPAGGKIVWFDGTAPITAWSSASHPAGSDRRWSAPQSIWMHSSFPDTNDHTNTTALMKNGDPPDLVWGDVLLVASAGSTSRTIVPRVLSPAALQAYAAGHRSAPFAYYVDHHVTPAALYVNFDPAASHFDVYGSALQQALHFSWGADNSVLCGIGVRGYANYDLAHDNSDASVLAETVDGVVIDQDIIQFNAIKALKMQGTATFGTHDAVLRSILDHNGAMGLDALQTDYILALDNFVYRNNLSGFAVKQAAGGMKFTASRFAIVTHNQVQSNLSTGVWFDVSSYDATVTNNYVDSNFAHGINYEISGGGAGSDPGTIIANNYVLRNGSRNNPRCVGAAWLSCSGIHLNESAHVTIKNNLLDGNQTNIVIIESSRFHDVRKPCGPAEACDPRYVAVDPVTHVSNSGIDFDVSDVAIYGNIYRDDYNLTGPMFTIQDVRNIKDACQMGVALAGDVFVAPFGAVWADCGRHGSISSYSKLSQFQTTQHEEKGAKQL